jgi:hypothetical protein
MATKKMTTQPRSDSDTYESVEDSLTPAEKYIYSRAKASPDIPFCYLDFKEKYAHGTIRNTLSSLRKKGLIRLYCRSGPAFYVPSFGKPKRPLAKMTLHRTVGEGGGVSEIRFDLGAFLDSLEWEELCRVHDVNLGFRVDRVYELFLNNGVGRLVERSLDLEVGSFVWSVKRVLRVVLHRSGMVTARLKCAECPVAVSLDSLTSLAAFLGGVRVHLIVRAVSLDPDFNEDLVPDLSNWIVLQWHYGRDGVYEISGPAFNASFCTWFGELARIYMRHEGKLFKPRMEVHEKPRKSLALAFAEKMDPAFSALKRLGDE